MNVLIYANCQGGGLKLLLAPELSKHGSISMHHEVNYEAINAHEAGTSIDAIPEHFLENLHKADVFVYQPLHEKYGVLSTERSVLGSVVRYLKHDCLLISVPYIVNDALWPIYATNKVIHADRRLLAAAKEANSETEFLKEYFSGSIKMSFFDTFHRTIAILREKESGCDIKISGYIIRSLTKKRLFLTNNHPTTDIFAEASRQIMEIISRRLAFSFDSAGFQERISALPQNAAGLEGFFPIDMYAYRHYGFLYLNGPDDISEEYYTIYLLAAFNALRGKPIGILPVPNFQQ